MLAIFSNVDSMLFIHGLGAIMAFGGLMAMVAYLIHSFVDFNLQIPANALSMVILIALLWSASALPRGKQAPPVVLQP